MWVLKFSTKEEAEARSFSEAENRLGDDHTTELWWGWIERDGQFWLLCDFDTQGAEFIHPVAAPIDATIAAGNAALAN